MTDDAKKDWLAKIDFDEFFRRGNPSGNDYFSISVGVNIRAFLLGHVRRAAHNGV